MKLPIFLRISSFLSVLVFLAVSTVHAQVVATVGDRSITMKDFNDRYDRLKKQTLNPPSKEVFLEDLIRLELGVREAEKRNLREDPIVRDRINQELYKAVVEEELAGKIDNIKITESEMRSYYEKSPEIKTSHILIEVRAEATKDQRAAAKKRAEEILAEVKKSNRSFEELVNLYTDDLATKKSGGDIGWQTRLTVAKEYYEAALKLKKDQISGIVESPFGYHIVKLTARNTYEQSTKRNVRTAVFDEKRNRLFDQFFVELKKKYPVKSNPALLK